MHTEKHGFTLIELSIVLVIIGLLVGGVMVGLDLIHAATVKNFVSSIDRYTEGASTFRVKYKSLPGDLSPDTAATYGFATRTGLGGQGDGDSILDGCARLTQKLGCETALFWRDMWDGRVSPAGLTAATNIPVDGTAGGFRIDDYLPPTPFRGNTSIFMYEYNSRNTFYISSVTAVASDGTLTTAPALTPQEARDIDDKIDDMEPENGIVRAMTDVNTQDMGAAPGATICVNNTLSKLAYDLLPAYSSNISCMISIRSQL